MTLRARVRRRLGDLALDVQLEVSSGEVVALLGPNGAGKTTLLGALAGLIALDAGRVELGGRVLEDPETRIRLPPEQRSVGMLFQDHLLFPHLSALDNVAFGLRAQGATRADASRQAAAWLSRLGLA
ncbi:MAG: ATP-binding cassette domain-containing protein, partial [Actinomycetota bacterium]|nr:ATP-binding cassette domain-containing protein [Actinomycetota bacterium]